MKKIVLAVMLLFSSSLFAEMAKETKMLPIFGGDYCADLTLALMGGVTQNTGADENVASYGVEFRFGCPVFQIKGFDIRQVLSAVYAEKDGFETISLEMNPRIMFPLTKDLEFGFGPGLGVIFAKNKVTSTTGGLLGSTTTSSTKNDTVFGVNVGASLHYNITKSIFVGLESRYQWTQDTNFGGTIDNFRNMLKVGTSF